MNNLNTHNAIKRRLCTKGAQANLNEYPSITPLKNITAVLVSALGVIMLTSSPLSAKQFTSQPQTTDVIELYTSEGCSSCPRADRWLSTLKNNNELFRDVIPMAFHVDYWDYIGWKDRFAKPAYSLRQRKHVAVGNSNQSYTPQFIANNSEWRAWFSGDRIWDANDKTVGVLKVSVPDQSTNLVNPDALPYKAPLRVSFNPQKNNWSSGTKTTHSNYVLNVAVLGMGLNSTVTAGENENRVLHHDFVVLNHLQKTVAANPAQWQLKMPVIPQKGQTKSALVVWISDPATQTTIQATGGYL